MFPVCGEEKQLDSYLYKGCLAKIDSLKSKGSFKRLGMLTEKHHDALIPEFCNKECIRCKTCHKTVKDNVFKSKELFQSEWYEADDKDWEEA